MFFGFVMTIASTISFAFADTPMLMLISRSLQGVGTSFSTVSGLGLLATKFSDAVERGYYLGLAFTGFGLGVLIGPPFGSVLFQFCGMHVPFYILAGIGVVDGILQLITLKVRQALTYDLTHHSARQWTSRKWRGEGGEHVTLYFAPRPVHNHNGDDNGNGKCVHCVFGDRSARVDDRGRLV